MACACVCIITMSGVGVHVAINYANQRMEQVSDEEMLELIDFYNIRDNVLSVDSCIVSYSQALGQMYKVR